MAQPKNDFLYCLTDEQGRSYQVSNGVVGPPVATPTPLKYTPDGWQDKTIKYARNITSMGMWRTFTTPFKYVKDAAFIVRNRLYRKGTEDKIYQVIHKLNKKFGGGWSYDFFYRGELDLSQAEDGDNSISVNIMEGDLVKLFKAYETTTYEFPLDVPEAVVVKMDGHYLNEKENFIIPGEISFTGNHIPYISFINKEGNAFGVEAYTVNGKSGTPNVTTSPDFFLASTIESIGNATLAGSVKFSTGNSGTPFSYSLFMQYSSGLIIPLASISGSAVGDTYTFPFLQNIDLLDGEKYFIYALSTGTTITYQDSNFSLSFRSRYKTTYIKGFRPAYVAQKLLDKITGGGYTFNSTYLSTEWENLLITSGDGIRAYDVSGNLNTGFKPPTIKLSWSDFFDSYNVPCNLCEGIRNQAMFIEKKEAAFQPTIQQALGEVTDLVVNPAKDFQYNVVKFGYPNTQTEDVNGKDEFNVTQTYTSPITRVSKTLELVSKFIASMYEIEITRINLDGKNTTDDNNDNRVFFLHVEKTATAGGAGEPSVYYKLLRNNYTSITGLLNPISAFNLELHPELCLYRHGNFLRSIFYWQDANNLQLQTSDKNGDVVVKIGTTTYIGNKTIRIGSLAPALFIPLTLKSKSPMPDNFITTMDNGPDGTFSLTYDGVPYYGFPMDVGVQPANRPAQESILLCSPQTDLNNLITMSR
jgi:hypothetical protein